MVDIDVCSKCSTLLWWTATERVSLQCWRLEFIRLVCTAYSRPFYLFISLFVVSLATSTNTLTYTFSNRSVFVRKNWWFVCWRKINEFHCMRGNRFVRRYCSLLFRLSLFTVIVGPVSHALDAGQVRCSFACVFVFVSATGRWERDGESAEKLLSSALPILIIVMCLFSFITIYCSGCRIALAIPIGHSIRYCRSTLRFMSRLSLSLARVGIYYFYFRSISKFNRIFCLLTCTAQRARYWSTGRGCLMIGSFGAWQSRAHFSIWHVGCAMSFLFSSRVNSANEFDVLMQFSGQQWHSTASASKHENDLWHPKT